MTDLPDIYLLRHGQTTWNAAGRIQGQRNSDLSGTGKAHADQQRQLLVPVLARLPDIDIHCSPLRRTRQTAAIALPGLIQRFQLDDRLKEVGVGAWEGRLCSDIEAEFPGAFSDDHRMLDKYLAAPGAETLDDLVARVDSFLADLRAPAIVVAHGILNAVLRGRVRGLVRDDWSDLGAEQGVVYHLSGGAETVLRLAYA